MKTTSFATTLAIFCSFLLAFACMIIPIDPAYKWLRPDLITLLVIYWVANIPNAVGIYFVFTVGLFFDLLTGMLFGSMGLSLAVVAFVAVNLRLRLRIYRPWQKFVIIVLLVGFAQLIRLWIQMAIGHSPGSATYWLGSISSALSWPIVVFALNYYQRAFNIR